MNVRMLGFLARKSHQKVDKATPAGFIAQPTMRSHPSIPTFVKHQCPGGNWAAVQVFAAGNPSVGRPEPTTAIRSQIPLKLLVAGNPREWGTWETQGLRAMPNFCKDLNLFSLNPTCFPDHWIGLFSSFARVISIQTKRSSLMSLFPLFFFLHFFFFLQIKEAPEIKWETNNYCHCSDSRRSSPSVQEFLYTLVRTLAYPKGNQNGRIQECTFCMRYWLYEAVWCLRLQGLKSSPYHHTMQQAGFSCFQAHRREAWSGRQIVWPEEGKPGRSRAIQKFKVFLMAAWNFFPILRDGTETITRDPNWCLGLLCFSPEGQKVITEWHHRPLFCKKGTNLFDHIR